MSLCRKFAAVAILAVSTAQAETIYVDNNNSPTVTNCTFSGNQAVTFTSDDAFSGGMDNLISNPTE